MSMENKDADNVTHENTDNSGNKPYKKRMSRQTVMTIAMICVSIFVISVATYAWYLISNAPKINSMSFKADTLGDLMISSDGTNYVYNIDLSELTSTIENKSLSPVTTIDGKVFYRPLYSNDKVVDLQQMNSNGDPINDEESLMYEKYVYEKTFYLRAGDDSVDQNNAKYYNIYLVGKANGATETQTGVKYDGCYMYTSNNSAAENDKTGAENALRISFEFDASGNNEIYAPNYNYTGSGNAYDKITTNIIRIYEPNADVHNTGGKPTDLYSAGIVQAETATANNLANYDNVKYNTIKQLHDQKFSGILNDDKKAYADKIKCTTAINDYDKAGSDEKSAILCVLKENIPVKVTMRVWVEGSDSDCRNGIAAKNIAGQIQFISEENLAQYQTKNTNEKNDVYKNQGYFNSNPPASSN